jgi:hypothetical protein
VKLILALATALALLAPIRANANTAYMLYWVTYFPGYSIHVAGGPYATSDECNAHARGYSNAGYYQCLETQR